MQVALIARLSWVPVACVAALAVFAAWAFRPLITHVHDQAPRRVTTGDSEEQFQLDLNAFKLPLWVAPPAPPEPPPEPVPPSPPAPLTLELLAVIDGDDTFSAVLYDPRSDRLLVLNEGQSIQEGQTIEEVTAGGVVIRAHDGVHTLALRERP